MAITYRNNITVLLPLCRNEKFRLRAPILPLGPSALRKNWGPQAEFFIPAWVAVQ